MPKLIVDNDTQTQNMSDEFMITKEFKNSAEYILAVKIMR